MWWIFPQLAKLGRSSTAQQFAIHSVKEAQAYLDHPILGPRYLECVTALQDLNTSDADAVFGEIDAKKLRSSLTLFELAYRSEARRVGKVCVSTFRSRWSPSH